MRNYANSSDTGSFNCFLNHMIIAIAIAVVVDIVVVIEQTVQSVNW